MEFYPFVFTILFMLLGPIRLIGPFAGATRDADLRFQRAVAIRATLICAVLMAFVVVSGRNMLNNYQISFAALEIAGGLVLLVAAMRTIFSVSSVPEAIQAGTSPLKAAASPVVSPIIVSAAGVAAILILTMFAPRNPGMIHAIAISLAIILALNFLTMYFNRWIVSVGWLMLVLHLLGAVLVFVQVALAVDTILAGLRDLGLVHAEVSSP